MTTIGTETNSAFSQLPAPGMKPNFVFSQSSLQDIADCRRRFYLRYIRHLAWPAPQAEPIVVIENEMLQGAAFHHLAHQYYLGIPVDHLNVFAQESPLDSWWRNFLEAQKSPPFLNQPGSRMVSEYSVVIPFHNFRLMAKYDLLITYSGNPSQTSTIIDWKTSHKRPRRRSQEQRLQTSVYPFVYHQARLASNPETPLQMLYWYTNYPDNPEVFDHTPEQHASTHQLLTTLIDLVSKPSTQNATVEQVYPLTVDENHCRYCVYRSLCNRGVAAGAFTAEGSLEVWDDSESGESDSIILSLEDISEIEF